MRGVYLQLDDVSNEDLGLYWFGVFIRKQEAIFNSYRNRRYRRQAILQNIVCFRCGSSATSSNRGTPMWFIDPIHIDQKICVRCHNVVNIHGEDRTYSDVGYCYVCDTVINRKRGLCDVCYPFLMSMMMSGASNPMYGIPSPTLHHQFTIEERESRSISKRGDKNPNWAGGLFSVYEQIRCCFLYKQMNKYVLERDCYKCVFCGGSPSGELHVHHIVKSFQILMDSHNITSLEQALEHHEIFDPTLCVLLCARHHAQFDPIYRRFVE